MSTDGGYNPQHGAPRQKSRVVPFIVGGLLGGFIGMVLGMVVGFGAGGAADSATGVKVATPAPVASGVGESPKQKKSPKPKPEVVGMGEGTYLVGEDIPAGRYRMAKPLQDDMCFWGAYVADTNQEDIINNDIVTGGRATVTLKKGQEFDSNGCGDWVKVN